MGCVTRGVIINNVGHSLPPLPLMRAVSQFLVKATHGGNRKKNTVPLDLISIWATGACVCVGGWFRGAGEEFRLLPAERPNAW